MAGNLGQKLKRVQIVEHTPINKTKSHRYTQGFNFLNYFHMNFTLVVLLLLKNRNYIMSEVSQPKGTNQISCRVQNQ